MIKMKKKPGISIIGCGGTISAAYTSNGVWKPGEMTEAEILKYVPHLGQTKKLKKVQEMMHHNYCGEITPEVRTIEQKPLYR